VPATCHAVEYSNTERGVVVRLIAGVMCVKMCVRRVVVVMAVFMDIHSPRSLDRPDADTDEEKSNKEFSPTGPRLEIDEATKYKANSSNDEHTDPMPEPPEHARPRCVRRILDGRGSKSSKMVHAGEYM
jgi:hypothetical protein